MQIDEHAPAIAVSETFVAADPDLVWDTLSDLASWPAWMPGVERIQLQSPLAVGATFTWRASRANLQSRFTTVERPTGLAWTGRTTGIRAVHAWTLEPRDGGTAVHTEESWGGLLPCLLRRPMRKALTKALDDGVAALGREAERRARSLPAAPRVA